MIKHLKDNHGNTPIWPAIIIAAAFVVILFVGFICVYMDAPIVHTVQGWIKKVWSIILGLFTDRSVTPL